MVNGIQILKNVKFLEKNKIPPNPKKKKKNSAFHIFQKLKKKIEKNFIKEAYKNRKKIKLF